MSIVVWRLVNRKEHNIPRSCQKVGLYWLSTSGYFFILLGCQRKTKFPWVYHTCSPPFCILWLVHPLFFPLKFIWNFELSASCHFLKIYNSLWWEKYLMFNKPHCFIFLLSLFYSHEILKVCFQISSLVDDILMLLLEHRISKWKSTHKAQVNNLIKEFEHI